LQHSLNLPAVATLDRIGANRFYAALTSAGADVRMPRRADAEPGLALALGGVGITLEDLTDLYAALGDGGNARPLLTEADTGGFSLSHSFVRERTARRVLDILARSPHPAGRVPAEVAQNAPEVAFKTGTSYGFRDAWSVGVANGYAIGVWVGRPDGAPRPGITGRDGALPILFDAFDVLGVPQDQPRPEERRQPPPAALAHLERSDREELSILFPPANAEVLVLDYGRSARGLSLSARGGRPPLTWYAEGERVGLEPSSGRAIWRPTAPGFYDVTVTDAEGASARVRVRIRNSG
jgi:penicillin-binding protein 1C